MNKIIEVKFGSHLYGTNTPLSDADFKAIYLPKARDIVLGRVRHNISTSRPKQEFEKNTKDDVDSETLSLGEYLRLLCEGQMMALDMLFAPDDFQVFKGKDYHLFQTIYDNKDKLLSKGIVSFIGYARQQASKYGIKGSRVRAVKNVIEFLTPLNSNVTRLIDIKPQIDASTLLDDSFIQYSEGFDPNGGVVTYFEICGRKFQWTNSVKYTLSILTKIYDAYGHRAKLAQENSGIDWKALSHAVRANSEGKELLETGFITFPCPNSKLLVDIKTGQLPYKEVELIIENGLADLEAAQVNSILRETADQQWVDDFLYDVYSNIVKA